MLDDVSFFNSMTLFTTDSPIVAVIVLASPLMSPHKTDCTANEQRLRLFVVYFPVQVADVFFVILGHWPQFEDVML